MKFHIGLSFLICVVFDISIDVAGQFADYGGMGGMGMGGMGMGGMGMGGMPSGKAAVAMGAVIAAMAAYPMVKKMGGRREVNGKIGRKIAALGRIVGRAPMGRSFGKYLQRFHRPKSQPVDDDYDDDDYENEHPGMMGHQDISGHLGSSLHRESLEHPGSTSHPGYLENPGSSSHPGSFERPESSFHPGSLERPSSPRYVHTDHHEPTRIHVVHYIKHASPAHNAGNVHVTHDTGHAHVAHDTGHTPPVHFGGNITQLTHLLGEGHVAYPVHGSK